MSVVYAHKQGSMATQVFSLEVVRVWVLVLWVFEDRNVSQWEINLCATNEGLAGVHQVALVVVEEGTPAAHEPAAEQIVHGL